MSIKLVKGIGRGKTELGAIDNAMHSVGIHNQNMIYLSSVIPSENEVEIVERWEDGKRWGSKLYVVMAHDTSTDKAEASIGWLYDDEGRGLFVEHSGAECKTQNLLTLDDLAETRGIENYEVDTHYQAVEADGEWVCAMVVAVFEEEDWNTI